MTDTAKKSTEPERPTEPQQEKTEDAPIVKADFSAMEKVKVAGELDLLTTAKAFAASGMFSDVKTQSQALVKIIAGYELQIPPFASMTGFHCIPRRKQVDGKWVETVEVSMSANLRAAVVRRDGNIDLKILEQSPEACEVEVAVRFAGQWEKRGSVRYTIEEARKVQVPAGGGNMKPLTDGQQWKNYPADMLFAAVMRRVSKRYAPHLFIGDRPSSDDDDLIAAASDVDADGKGDVVEAELVEEGSTATHEAEGDDAGGADGDAGQDSGQEARDGGNGQDVAPPPEEPEAAHAEDPVAPSGSGKSDGPEATSEPSSKPEVIYVGIFPVEVAGEGPWKLDAEGGGGLCTKEQITVAEKHLGKLNLTAGALPLVVQARYRVALGQASKTALDELNKWLEAQVLIVEARAKAAKK